MKAVILAAGYGSRLWPLSTPENPKQFQPLIKNQSLLAYTYNLLAKILPADDIYVQIRESLEPLVSEVLGKIDPRQLILIPEHRDTLAEVLWTLNCLAKDDGGAVLFKSVDQYVAPESDFLRRLKKAITNYDRNSITLLCAEYDAYSANSGYVVTDESLRVSSFLEKPAPEVVEDMRTHGKLFRSLFAFIADYENVMRELRISKGKWAKPSERLLGASKSARRSEFLRMPTLDISSTLFQQAAELQVASLGSSRHFLDIGSFRSLHDLNPKDANGNVVIGNVLLDRTSRGNFIFNNTKSKLVVIDTSDSAIISTASGSLIATLGAANQIKHLL